MDDDKRQETYSGFMHCVNMAPAELEEWLRTDESGSVGDSDDGENTGHASGLRTVEIRRTKKADLTDDQYAHIHKVVGYALAQRPSGDIKDARWRYLLMNWGHDPLKGV